MVLWRAVNSRAQTETGETVRTVPISAKQAGGSALFWRHFSLQRSKVQRTLGVQTGWPICMQEFSTGLRDEVPREHGRCNPGRQAGGRGQRGPCFCWIACLLSASHDRLHPSDTCRQYMHFKITHARQSCSRASKGSASGHTGERSEVVADRARGAPAPSVKPVEPHVPAAGLRA